MKIIQSLSIKNKLIFIILSVTILSLSIGFTIDLIKTHEASKDKLISESLLNAKLVSEYCITPLDFGYNDEAKVNLSKLETIPTIYNGYVFDLEGHVFASYNRTELINIPELPIDDISSFFEDDWLHVFRKIKFNEEIKGTIYLRVSTAELYKYLRANIISKGFIGIVLILIAFFIAVRLERIISQPILVLADTAKKISLENDYTIRLEKRSTDEIGVLYDSFNNMLEQIKTRESQRDKAKEALHKYEHIVSSSTDMLAFMDKQYTYLAANKEYMKAFDLTTEKLIGKTVDEVFGKKFFNSVIKPYADRCLGGEEVNIQDWFNFPSTGKCYMDINYHPYYADDKQILGFVVNGRNITDRKQAEEELQESNEKYLNLMESLGTGVVLHGSDTSIVFSNPKASEILGISREQMIGKKAIDPRWRFVRNDGTDMPLEEYPVNKALRTMKPFSEYFIGIKRPDRKYITWINVNASLVYDEYKKIKYVTISFNDTTEQKQAEEKLKESELLLKEAQKLAHIGHWELDIVTNNLLWSDEIYRIFELSPQEFEATYNAFIDAIYPEDREYMNEAYSQSVKNRTPYDIEHRLLLKKGKIKFVRENCRTEYDSKGKPFRSFGTVQDITEQKIVQQKLEESEAKLNALFTSLTEMVVMHELVLNAAGVAIDYCIIDCNKVFTEVTGISKEDAIGKLATEVYQTDPPPYLEKYSKVALGGDPHEFTTYSLPLDKHLMISVISPQSGKFATITTDISDMMQIQEMIIAKNKEMENYLYVASHDLRTPLVNIQGFSQRLKKQADLIKTLFADKALEPGILNQLTTITDEDIPKTLSFVLSNIEKMDNLINGLLQLSRTGFVEMNIQEIDMNALFAKILQSLDFQIKEAQCEIHINPLPKCYGDAALLDQLFANIISNALKYSDSERALEITVDAKKSFRKVVYTIRDTGKGIAQKHLEKIWDIFYRIGICSGKTGDGIGLSLVKRIAEKHKGKVWVESEENKGSVFYIELHNRSFKEF